MTKYSDLVRQLYSANLYLRVKMGLENIHRLHNGLGQPLNKVKTIVHVAGTNGKGSVCIKVARALQAAGLNTGLFVSPHIACFRERAQMNGNYITEAQVEQLLPQVFKAVKKHQIPGTFFEMTTAMAFLYYAEMGANAAVLETGLGGRLDSTNICQPSITVVTSISQDHTKILGSTVEDIAREKGGIFKPNVPVVLGPMRDARALDTLQEIAHNVGAGPVTLVPPLSDDDDNVIGTQDFVLENERTASAVMKILHERNEISLNETALQQALSTNPPCRFQEVSVFDGTQFVLDVAHNPEALRKFFDRFLRLHNLSSMNNVQVVIGMSVDKDLEKCLETVRKWILPENTILVQSGHPRAAPVSSLERHLPGSVAMIPGSVHDNNGGSSSLSSISQGISFAIERSKMQKKVSGTAAPIIICGSLYIMDEVLQVLGIAQNENQKDPLEIQKAWTDRKVGKEPPVSNAKEYDETIRSLSVEKVKNQ
jgi:dihydrofolate synthase/folylpolyglutamate synthase